MFTKSCDFLIKLAVSTTNCHIDVAKRTAYHKKSLKGGQTFGDTNYFSYFCLRNLHGESYEFLALHA